MNKRDILFNIIRQTLKMNGGVKLPITLNDAQNMSAEELQKFFTDNFMAIAPNVDGTVDPEENMVNPFLETIEDFENGDMSERELADDLIGMHFIPFIKQNDEYLFDPSKAVFLDGSLGMNNTENFFSEVDYFGRIDFEKDDKEVQKGLTIMAQLIGEKKIEENRIIEAQKTIQENTEKLQQAEEAVNAYPSKPGFFSWLFRRSYYNEYKSKEFERDRLREVMQDARNDIEAATGNLEDTLAKLEQFNSKDKISEKAPEPEKKAEVVKEVQKEAEVDKQKEVGVKPEEVKAAESGSNALEAETGSQININEEIEIDISDDNPFIDERYKELIENAGTVKIETEDPVTEVMLKGQEKTIAEQQAIKDLLYDTDPNTADPADIQLAKKLCETRGHAAADISKKYVNGLAQLSPFPKEFMDKLANSIDNIGNRQQEVLDTLPEASEPPHQFLKDVAAMVLFKELATERALSNEDGQIDGLSREMGALEKAIKDPAKLDEILEKMTKSKSIKETANYIYNDEKEADYFLTDAAQFVTHSDKCLEEGYLIDVLETELYNPEKEESIKAPTEEELKAKQELEKKNEVISQQKSYTETIMLSSNALIEDAKSHSEILATFIKHCADNVIKYHNEELEGKKIPSDIKEKNMIALVAGVDTLRFLQEERTAYNPAGPKLNSVYAGPFETAMGSPEKAKAILENMVKQPHVHNAAKSLMKKETFAPAFMQHYKSATKNPEILRKVREDFNKNNDLKFQFHIEDKTEMEQNRPKMDPFGLGPNGPA